MATFVWRNTLTVSVGEMSRTAALECCQRFDTLAQVYTNTGDLLAETDILTVLYAPLTVKVGSEPFAAGERTLELDDGERVTLTLPLTREGFMALPMSLTAAWISAAVRSNGWLVDILGKVFAPTSETGSAPKSDGAPLNALNPMNEPTKTTGA